MCAKKNTGNDDAPAAGAELIEVGQPAPAWQLPDGQGQARKLAEYRGKWVVLYFYPKDDTSGCTVEACEFRDALPQFVGGNAQVLGISPDSPAAHQRFAGKYQLTFTLLADEGAKVCSQYGVWQQKSMYGRKYMGVVRTTYLIDPAGKVAFRWDKVKPAGHAAQVREKIAELAGK